jgi:hypothetical protein
MTPLMTGVHMREHGMDMTEFAEPFNGSGHNPSEKQSPQPEFAGIHCYTRPC